MPVQLQGQTLIVSDFWQAVRLHLERDLADGPAADWTVVLRPHAAGDETRASDGNAARVDPAAPAVALGFPDDEGGDWGVARDLAAALAQCVRGVLRMPR